MVKSVESVQLSVEPARVRQTAENDFSSMLQRGAQSAVQALASGTRAVAQFAPGGSFVSAVANAFDAAAAAIGGSEGGTASLLAAQQRLQEEGFANSMRLLELQRKMQKESEAVSTVSNMMKAKHETAKNTINNIR